MRNENNVDAEVVANVTVHAKPYVYVSLAKQCQRLQPWLSRFMARAP